MSKAGFRLLRSSLFLLLVLCAPAAQADPGAPTAPFLAPDDIELLPLPERRLDQLRGAHAALFDGIEAAGDALRELAERAREEPGGAWQEAERRTIEARRLEATNALGRILIADGVDAGAIARAASFPRGPARVARFAHAQVLGLERLAPKQRALLATLIASLDGALRVLVDPAERQPADGEDGALPPTVRERIENDLEARRERLETRFWRVVDYVLAQPAKAALKRRLPVAFQGPDDWLPHALQLVGLTLGQAGRLRSIEAGQEAELGPDLTLAERLGRQLESPDPASAPLTDAEREKLEQQVDAAWGRVTEIEIQTADRVRAALGAKLWEALRAIPPHLEPEQRQEGPAEVLLHVDFDDAQISRLGPLVRHYRKLQREMDVAYEKLERTLDDIGPDSPQMDAMEMSETVLTGKLVAEVRVLMREVFLDIMRPAQVVDWVFAPAGD